MNNSLCLVEKNTIFPENGSAFSQCHASTIIILPNGDKLVAFFAGTKEGHSDTAIWISRQASGEWLAPVKVIDEPMLPHWNPVLYYELGKIWLFYKVGSDVQQWVTKIVVSNDLGYLWSSHQFLVEGSTAPRGPVKNKLIQLSNGEWIAPNSIETDCYWDVLVDKSTDSGVSWNESLVPCDHQPTLRVSDDMPLWQGLMDGALWETEEETVFKWDGVIQPTLWESSPGHVHMLMRSTRGAIYRSDSNDWGNSWCEVYATELPNNNSGIDATSSDNGIITLVYNPIAGNWGARTPISIAQSRDNGETWVKMMDLEVSQGEYSYPAIIYHEGYFHVTYTSNRKTIVYHCFKNEFS